MLFFQIDAKLFHEPRLQLLHARKPFVAHALEAFRIRGPLLRGAFVAADMYIRIREDAGDIVQHAFQKVNHLVATHIEHIVRDAAEDAYGVCFGRIATEGRIGRDGSYHVPRHIDFRNNLYVARLGVGYDIAQLLLRVPHAAAIFCVIIEHCAVARIGERRGAYAAHFRKQGIFGDFHAPALVVGEMPVQAVEFIERHDVEHALHFLNREEVAGAVKHETAMPQQRRVLNADEGQRPFHTGIVGFFFEDRPRQELAQRIQTVEETRRRGGAEAYARICDIECISF